MQVETKTGNGAIVDGRKHRAIEELLCKMDCLNEAVCKEINVIPANVVNALLDVFEAASKLEVYRKAGDTCQC